MKHLTFTVRDGVLAVLFLCLPLASVRAQTTAIPPDPATAADATPTPRPRPKPKPKPTPDVSTPVGTINGTAIYRPLMKSLVADPLDRALLIGDYNRRLPKLTDAQIEEAVRSYKHAKFSDNDAAIATKLTQLGANQDDFRRFVAEETKLRIVLNNVTRGSVSDESAQRAQSGYIASLRQKASVNQPKKP